MVRVPKPNIVYSVTTKQLAKRTDKWNLYAHFILEKLTLSKYEYKKMYGIFVICIKAYLNNLNEINAELCFANANVNCRHLSFSTCHHTILRCCFCKNYEPSLTCTNYTEGVVQVLWRCYAGVIQVLFRCYAGVVQALCRCYRSQLANANNTARVIPLKEC